ncbi:galactokinase [Algibacter amylolyticus]|uniref:Galactokinase n=1 Tax=Algibacter amylolyticus TaxID=1608400 RepID=A0A5M7AV11_9FLAO|nr:galactokinase [Algibacter amylolyticus]KAA5821189.1 galactokinase [Algibacter amylolyticus]MBB5269836.1 galactokinase [Algibacter amylolyticus]TSJ72135.1 galactokinase [Algibacter amylolyticus]
MTNTLIKEVKTAFLKEFKTAPLLIFSPGRINIIGEHTDYNDGFVFPAAVNKGIAAAIEKSDTGQSTAIALDLDSTIEFNLDTLKPSKEGSWENYVFGVVAEIQNRNKTIGNFNIVFKGNIPGGAGMSSSAALENSVVFGLNELFQLGLSKEDMILISQKAEHNYVGVKCGIMDQYASMFGKKDYALHLDCRTIKSKPYKIDFKDHQLMLINTNVKHSLSDSAYNDRRSACEAISELLNIKALRDATEADLETVKDKVSLENYQKALYVIQENKRTIKAAKAIKNNDLETLGALIYQSHEGLSSQYKVSCDELDFLVAQAKQNKHVLGARMMGGGFGGCTINLVAKNEAEAFAETASKAYKKQFDKDCSVYFIELSDGTHLIK